MRKMLLIAAMLFTQLAVASGAESYAEPSKNYSAQYKVMKSGRFLEIFDSLAKGFAPNVFVVTKECGVVNAWYSPKDKSITICYELLADAEKFINDKYKSASTEDLAALRTGPKMGVYFHELAHAIIDVHNVPVLGGEEDAADKIATIILLEFTKKSPEQGKSMLIGNLAYNWEKKKNFLDKLVYGRHLYADEHPLTEQRVFNIVCLAYGSNPQLFLDIAQQFKLPNARAARCRSEYQDAWKAVDQLMSQTISKANQSKIGR